MQVKSFRCFTYVIGISPTSQLILQPFRHFTYIKAHSTTLPLFHLRHRHFTYVTAHSPTLSPLHLRHSLFYIPSAASPTSQIILQPFRCFTYVTGASRTSPSEPPTQRGIKNSLWLTSLSQQITKFRSSYSFGQLLRILLRAVNLCSFSHIVSGDSSFSIHNVLYFVKYPSRAAQNSPEGRKRPAGPGLRTPALMGLLVYFFFKILYNAANFTSQTIRLLSQFSCIKIHVAAAPKSQDRLKRMLSNGNTGYLVVRKALSLNLNFSFLNRISLLVILSSYPVVLTRLGGPRSRPYSSRKNYKSIARNRSRDLLDGSQIF